MFRIFMISVWAAGTYYLIKSYVSGVANISMWKGDLQHTSDKLHNTSFIGASFNNMSDLTFWFNFGAIVVLVMYAVFTKQIWKEFGPNAK